MMPDGTIGAMNIVATDRLTLRPFTAADLPLLTALHTDPQVMRYLGNGHPMTADQIAADLADSMAATDRPPGCGRWAAEVNGRFVGRFGLWARDDRPDERSIGYRLCSDAQGHGYATEGARWLIRRAFADPAVHRVYAETMAVNVGSRAVMQRAGLRWVRTFHLEWDEPIPGAEQGEVEYAIDRVDWTG